MEKWILKYLLSLQTESREQIEGLEGWFDFPFSESLLAKDDETSIFIYRHVYTLHMYRFDFGVN